MKSLIFATNNKNKIEEIRSALGSAFAIVTLQEAGIDIDIPEPHQTLQENASEKSSTIFKLTKKDCFSEDTGLEVMALNGEPGVKSARYAGEDKNNDDNIQKLLQNLQPHKNKSAQFKTIISLILNENEYFFEGICTGQIIDKKIGANGFGYDAIFIPDGAQNTFAEMDMEQKNKYSHRKKALEKLIEFLSNTNE
jgi:XTP/dITP diphosphohydrolase